MIAIRTFMGDSTELAEFTSRVWRATYAGKMIYPMWDAGYFDWQLLADRPHARDYLVAAYDGERLVGILLAEKCVLRLRGKDCEGTMRSWLTVDPDYQRQGIASMLASEMRKRYEQSGIAFSLGFLYTGSSGSEGPKFWLKRPEMVPLAETGFWARILDNKAVAKWELSRLNGVGALALKTLQWWPISKQVPTGVRPYLPDDHAACVGLADGLLNEMDLGFVWTEERLAHQLSRGNTTHTLVFESQGRVRGFVNYYTLDMMGRHPLKTAIIDLIAYGDMTVSERKKLVRAALGHMLTNGVKLALMLRLPCYPWLPLVGNGFIPLPNEMCVMGNVTDPSVSLKNVKRLHVHFR